MWGFGMASRDKMDLLRVFLGSLPPGVAGNVARAVEVDRMNNGRTLPHEMILETLRSSLRDGAKAERALTPLRLFCRPFEDLLVNNGFPNKQKGRIPRGSITPVWNWLSQDLIPEATMAFSLAVKTAAMGHEQEQLEEKVLEFWASASGALRARLASDGGWRPARQALGNEGVVQDAREMSLLLAAGAEVCELQEALPQTLSSLTEEAVQTFRAVHEKLVARLPDAAPYLAVVVMKRLEQPWEALRLPLGEGQATQTEPGEETAPTSDLGLVGELLLAAIDAHGAAIVSANPEGFNADALVGHLDGYTTISNGVTKEVELRRDGVWGQRLVKDRALVVEAMENFMARAPEEVFAALVTQNSETGAVVPDLSRAADPDSCDRALSYARLIEGCRSLADAASFGASLKLADSQIGAMLMRYNEAIVRELDDADEEKRLNAEQYAAVATELTAILISPEHGEHLRRQGRAAATSMAA